MRRFSAILALLWCAAWAGLGVWGACPANNPNNPNALTVQGPGPDGNSGYPIAVVGATGCPLDVNVTSSISQCVTQCTSPWVVSGTVVTSPPTLADGDGLANQTAQPVLGFPHGYNGATWDRLLTYQGGFGSATGKGLLAAAPLMFNNNTNTFDIPRLGTNSSLRVDFPDAKVPGLNTLGCGFSLSPGLPGGYLVSATYQPVGNGETTTPQTLFYNGGSNLALAAVQYTWDGATTRVARTPSVFKTVATAAAGNTALWTPAAGKKFRLMRWRYTVTDNATLAAPGVLIISLFDGAAGATGQADDTFVPALALNNDGQLASSPWIDLGNGYLSTVANNVLNVNLSAALATGTVRVQVAGTEE